MTIQPLQNGWDKHKRHVEAELQRGAVERKEIMGYLREISNQLAANSVTFDSMAKDVAENRQDIKANTKAISTAFKDISNLSVELKIKAGFWGALGAAIPSAIAVIYILAQGS